ncbi:hypothetical protein V8G54_007865, partial [Vigna mungo]
TPSSTTTASDPHHRSQPKTPNPSTSQHHNLCNMHQNKKHTQSHIITKPSHFLAATNPLFSPNNPFHYPPISRPPAESPFPSFSHYTIFSKINKNTTVRGRTSKPLSSFTQ